ncbi:MAG: hypothetical protein DLM72_02765 [Candidatus Nitrosopolaris wilkensis]|nr:MAG: hypothetical protein DLM72_02765 [Candidatus Nitrosopolaris wilkensis]
MKPPAAKNPANTTEIIAAEYVSSAIMDMLTVYNSLIVELYPHILWSYRKTHENRLGHIFPFKHEDAHISSI